MQAGSWSRDSPYVLGIDRLKVLHILFGGMRMNVHVLHSRLRRPVVEDISRQRALAEGVEIVHELIVRAVVEEAQ